LAGITPCAGYISQQWAILVGFILGVASFYVAWFSKRILRVDDALDVIAIHGITGIIGTEKI